MTYDEAIAFWYGRINYEVRAAGPGDLSLDQMRGLLMLLGNPHERLRTIHIAGSKGKGSTAAMLASVLRAAGYRTGLFTSPHLSQVEERIQVDGAPISRGELTALLGEIHGRLMQGARGRGGEPLAPTFFEIATAVGFLHFVRRRVDVAVIEVGLGGRFDSTNVCRPLVSVITSISFDHTRQLGNTLDRIAAEKAGIIKPRVPVISGATAPLARQVIETVACQHTAPLWQLDVDFRFSYEPGRVTGDNGQRPGVRVETSHRQWPRMELGLVGEHQAANAAVSVACIEELRHLGLNLPDKAVAEGLATVSWPARMELLGRRPMIVIDCAHNVASAQALAETLHASFPPRRRVLIFAGSNDKDLAGMLHVLAPHFAHICLTRFRTSPRAVPPEVLAEALAEGQVSFSTHATAAEALAAARTKAGPEDLICVAGSVFLAGELRAELRGSMGGSGSM